MAIIIEIMSENVYGVFSEYEIMCSEKKVLIFWFDIFSKFKILSDIVSYTIQVSLMQNICKNSGVKLNITAVADNGILYRFLIKLLQSFFLFMHFK